MDVTVWMDLHGPRITLVHIAPYNHGKKVLMMELSELITRGIMSE